MAKVYSFGAVLGMWPERGLRGNIGLGKVSHMGHRELWDMEKYGTWRIMGHGELRIDNGDFPANSLVRTF